MLTVKCIFCKKEVQNSRRHMEAEHPDLFMHGVFTAYDFKKFMTSRSGGCTYQEIADWVNDIIEYILEEQCGGNT